MRRPPRSCRTPRSCVEPVYVTELLPGDARDVLACGPEPMLEALRAARARRPSSPGRRRWRAATAPATAARSRSTASSSVSASKGRCSVLLLNASGCLDALAAPDVARSLDAFVTKTVTPRAARRQPAGADRRDGARDAELDRARESRARALPRRDAAAAAASSACRSGCRSAASRRTSTPRPARRSRTSPRSSSTSRARTSTRRPRARPRSSPPAAPRPTLPLYAKLSPAAWDIAEVARAVEAPGADGLSLVNTMRGLALDARRCARRSRAAPAATRARR